MKILFITLSNIGDVILTMPTLDRLIVNFPKAEVDIVCGERAVGLFKDNYYVKNVITYSKTKGFQDMVSFFLRLRKKNYDLIVDLKNTALPLLLKGKIKTYPWLNAPNNILHMRERFLYKIKRIGRFLEQEDSLMERFGICVSKEERVYIEKLLESIGVSASDKLVVVSPGARSHIKRWPQEKFAVLADRLIAEFKVKIVITGDEKEVEICKRMQQNMASEAVNLCGRLTLKYLASLVEKACLVISCDSATMHMSSYFNRPTLAIFGPTDDKKYGPWSKISRVIKSKLSCLPCEVAQCRTNNLDCMNKLEVDEVYAQTRELL